MKKFEMHQKDAIMAKMHDLSLTVFVSYDGESWEARGIPCELALDSMDAFAFDPDALYVTVRKENEEVARECLIEGKAIEVSDRCHFVVTKENIFDHKDHWLVFLSSDAEFTIKKDPLIMWVAATNEWCSKPHNSASDLASKLSLDYQGEIVDGQEIGVFVFNMIKVVL